MNRESDLGLGRNPAPTVNITQGPAPVRISPTVGRVVWFTPADADLITRYGGQRFAAIVAYVWSDWLVNLTVFDHDGYAHARTSVPLLQDGEPKQEGGHYCEWMPYQKGQAAKLQAAGESK